MTLAASFGVSVALVSVTERELASSAVARVSADRILETAVLGESRWGQAVWGSDQQAHFLEQILRIISNGSFPAPGKRSSLSSGEARQLRDAMILAAHARERRDVFVSNDERGFVRAGRRERLEELLGTRIVTLAEFRSLLTARASNPSGRSPTSGCT